MQSTRAWLAIVCLLVGAEPAQGQGHAHPPGPSRDTAEVHRRHSPARQPARPVTPRRGATGHGPMDHAAMGHAMPAMLGPYAMSREASGTAWQPDATPHEGIHVMRGPWSLMLHGFAFLISNHQGGDRGDDELVSTNMLMGMATRPVGRGRLGLRAMLSAEPWSLDGSRGYALLLQTGETADRNEHLIDRQHPHDLFMELAGTASVDWDGGSAFLYGGLPGEPALGPPAFMHRFSGVPNPASPIAHHWLDSTHITYGVLSLGVVLDAVKVEASTFRGREPDEERADIETGPLDSHAFRVSWNPDPRWSLQASFGRLDSPEQLAPDVDLDRLTTSAVFHAGAAERPWQTMVAYGRNRLRPGPTLEAWLAESAVTWSRRNTAFTRVERVEKNELFPESDPRADDVFTVAKLGGGYMRDVAGRDAFVLSLGASADLSIVPEALEDAYAGRRLSAMVFLRGALR
jgi:hypothetical protein